VIAIILVGSLLIAAVAPLQGLDYEGRLRGVFDHKNDLGDFAAVALLVSTALLFDRHGEGRASLLFNICIAVLSVLALLWADAASPVPVLIFSLTALGLAHVMRNAGRWLTALMPLLVASGITVIVLLVFNIPTLAHLLDRSTDLSGRTKVWAFSLKMIFERPIEGYGYGAFWTGADSPGSVFWHISHLAVPHAHNGYLQLLLDAGVVGLVLALTAIFSAFFRLGCLLRYDRLTPIPWAMAYLCFLSATQITEPGIWTGNSLLAVLFVAVVVQSNVLARRPRYSRTDFAASFGHIGRRGREIPKVYQSNLLPRVPALCSQRM
jgi:exopolysaccharide production protein ExoQ